MPFDLPTLPLGKWIESIVDFLLIQFQGFFDTVTDGVRYSFDLVESLLFAIPAWVFILIVSVIALKVAGRSLALLALFGFLLIYSLGYWQPTMETFALVAMAELITLTIGLPLGILSAKNDTVDKILRPVLDFMQTMPAFVYLIPAVIFFGLGMVPGVMATVIFSLPPMVRLTNLGIRQVPKEMIEAAQAFGSNPHQILVKVQLPVATPTIMAGVNQSIMLALSMVVIAAMIGARGLGSEVWRSIQRLRIGDGFESGLAVVILAIVLDRVTQSLGNKKSTSQEG